VELRYDPVKNPFGARPTVFDVARNVYAINPITGFALRPFDNVGVQYGLAALNGGAISTTQFLNLNERIGGFDQDANYVANRSVGSIGAIRRAQQAGLNLGGNGGLASIPVFDSGSYNDTSGYHYQWYHFAIRERLIEANRQANNHVMWRGSDVPQETAWQVLNEWVMAIKSDHSNLPDRVKVVLNKPADAVDGCWPTSTQFISEPQTRNSQPDTQCNAVYPSYTFPRFVAGGPLAANKLKCQLKPIDLRDYDVVFTGAELTRLQSIFPDGVCDWSKPGVNQTGVVPWPSFGPSPDNLVFDITHP
jgi:hypothetical protein